MTGLRWTVAALVSVPIAVVMGAFCVVICGLFLAGIAVAAIPAMYVIVLKEVSKRVAWEKTVREVGEELGMKADP